ncbi:MAG: SCO family protein [Caldilineaceae bacterium]
MATSIQSKNLHKTFAPTNDLRADNVAGSRATEAHAPSANSTTPTTVNRPHFLSAQWWLVIASLPVLAILAFAIFQPLLVLPRAGLAPGFRLVDQYGNDQSHENFRGHITLYNFTYTSCVTPCPQTATVMADLRDQIPQINTRDIPVALVTISFDPTRDTLDQLQRYAQQFDVDTKPSDREQRPPWYIMTGEETSLKYIVGGGFGVYYKGNEDQSFTFDPMYVLVDGAGIIRAKYRTATPDLDTVQRDISLVAKEASESTGAAHLAYEAAHLFLCYPK